VLQLSGVDQPSFELPGGTRMPVLGLGVWQLAAGRETERAVEWALEAGYRHVDTASMYHNEASVGAAVRRSDLPRDDVFVTTKLMPTHASAARELDKSLKRLGFDYVDLYLIHWPIPGVTTRYWRQLQELRDGGLAKEVGVSNFGVSTLERLQQRGSSLVPAVNQIQFSPFQYRRRLLEYCLRHGIVFEAYSPLARGRVTDPAIVAIAERLGRTAAQVMLRWAVQHQAVVIPKSSDRERIRSNAQIFDFELGDEDMRALDALDRTNGSAEARR
jgi:diketogulonate reductase-like aldo/keto reductase